MKDSVAVGLGLRKIVQVLLCVHSVKGVSSLLYRLITVAYSLQMEIPGWITCLIVVMIVVMFAHMHMFRWKLLLVLCTINNSAFLVCDLAVQYNDIIIFQCVSEANSSN